MYTAPARPLAEFIVNSEPLMIKLGFATYTAPPLYLARFSLNLEPSIVPLTPSQ
jgi:hypothetical protein